jgi:REP element-mobilizing transposase RayT
MPRMPREKSYSGVYHAMIRGINKQDIFQDKEDRIVFLEKLKKVKERSECKIYAYCLMNNHVHLLIGEGNETIGQVMRRLGSTYVLWYNKKYNRVGYLFQGRFRSEPVDTDSYLLVALRYIHQNPVKAGLSRNCSDYPWTSYHEYISPGKQAVNLIDTELGLDVAGGLKQFVEFHQGQDDCDMIDIDDNEIADIKAEKLIKRVLKEKSSIEIHKLSKPERNQLIRELKSLPGVNQRQIEEVTGLSRSIIQRA